MQDPDMIDAIESLRRKMNSEYEPMGQLAFQARMFEQEMQIAEVCIDRAEQTRTRIYSKMMRYQPELPAPYAATPLEAQPEQPMNLQGHYSDPYQDDIPMPSYLRERP